MATTITEVDLVDIQKAVRKELLIILADQPEFGSVGLCVHFHQGKICRISTSREVTRKAGVQ